jgi:peptide/nickel transport system substrate-binding protein
MGTPHSPWQRLHGLPLAATLALSLLVACAPAPPPAAPAAQATSAPAAPTTAPKPAAQAPASGQAAQPAATQPAGQTAAQPAAGATQPAGQTAAQPAAGTTQAPTGTLTFIQSLLPIVADPHVEYLNSSWGVNYSIYDPLARVDEEGKLTPYLATSWKMEDPTTWIFQLRRDAKWHDGAPVTSKDVVFSIQRLLDPATKSYWTGIYSYVTGAEAIDDYSVRIKTKSLVVALPQDFGRMAMLPKDQFEKAGKDAFFQKPIGSGPFKFVSQVQGERMTLEANEQYWGEKPKVKTLVLKQVSDAATRVAELMAGTADIVDGIPPNEVERINGSGTSSVLAAPTVRRIMLQFAISTTPELKDARIRQAVGYAIDAEAINKGIYGGKAGVQTGWLDRFSFGYNKDLKPRQYDPAKSKQLLAEAGYPDGMPIDFTSFKGRFLLDDEVSLAIADYLGKGGFKVNFKSMEFATFSTAMNKGELRGVFLSSSGNSTGDPDQVFRSFDSKRQALYVIDPALDALIDKQASETDPVKRAAAVAEVDAYIHTNTLDLNLMTVPGLYGLNKRVQGWKPSPFEVFSFVSASVR